MGRVSAILSETVRNGETDTQARLAIDLGSLTTTYITGNDASFWSSLSSLISQLTYFRCDTSEATLLSLADAEAEKAFYDVPTLIRNAVTAVGQRDYYEALIQVLATGKGKGDD